MTAKMLTHELHQQDMQNNHSDVMLVTERSKQDQARGSQDVIGAMRGCFAAHEEEKQSIAKGCKEIADANEAELRNEQQNCINYLTNLANDTIAEKDKNEQERKNVAWRNLQNRRKIHAV